MPVGKITTTGTDADPIETPHQSGESITDWKRRHKQKVQDANPDGDTLTTTWPHDSAGSMKTTTTDRESGERDDSFETTHITEYQDEMASCPPVTQWVQGS